MTLSLLTPMKLKSETRYLLYYPAKKSNQQSIQKMITMEKSLNYEDAYTELQNIAAAIQDELVTVDELSQKLKRASELIVFCQTKLRATEKEVNKIIQQMEGKQKDQG